MRPLNPRRTRVLEAASADPPEIERLSYDYYIVQHILNAVVPQVMVSATVYALESDGLVKLHRDGRVELTDRGRRHLTRTRE